MKTVDSAKDFRRLAADLLQKSHFVEEREFAAKLNKIARFYLRLAEEADRN